MLSANNRVRCEVRSDLPPDRPGLRTVVHHTGHHIETVAAQDLRELAKLQAVVALRISLDGK